MLPQIIPLPSAVQKRVTKDKEFVVADLGNSKLTGKQIVAYFTNLQVPFEFAPCDDKQKKFDAFKEFICSRFKTQSVQLIDTLIRAMSIYHNKDIGDGPNFLTAEEIEEFIGLNKELFDSIIEYYNAMPYTLMSMIDQYKKHFLDPLIEAGQLIEKKDDRIPINVIKLAGLPDFIEEYLSWVGDVQSNVCFAHTMKAGEHVHKLITERPNNASVSLLYALANQKFTEPDPAQEA
jgi:hypothetical protein